ncbi:MAG: hypothetical protein KC910_18290, partial [Candidatus Eremiobacteraeota bacterium]|nr:hypothetical protein [Candidatus Eremiobacteraeota bacterium]
MISRISGSGPFLPPVRAQRSESHACDPADQVDINQQVPTGPSILGRLARYAKLWHGLAILSSLSVSLGAGASFAGQDPVAQMVSRDADMTPTQRVALGDELAAFDRDELSFVARAGTEIQVTESDAQTLQVLREHGRTIRPVSMTSLVQQANALDRLGKDLSHHPRLLELNARIDRLAAEAAGQPRPDPCAPPATSPLDEARNDRHQFLVEQVRKAGLDPAVVVGGRFDVAGLVRHSQARSQAEKAEYRSLVEMAAGGRLTSAVDLESQAIFVPAARYAYPAEGVALRVHPSFNLDHLTGGAHGFHSSGDGLLQVDANTLGTRHTARHETGHAVMARLRAVEPGFYKEWSAQLNEAFTQANQAARC